MSSPASRFLGRLSQQTCLILFGHILNWPWKDRLSRRKTRYKATRKAALLYLKRYIPYIKGLKPDEEKSADRPEHAFTIWLQGEDNAPELVKACIRSMRRHLAQPLVVLDEKNLFDWVDIPDYVVRKWKEGKIGHAHFCDVCRVDLLYRHGGVWLDATDFVTQAIPERIMKEDFFMFMSGSKIRGSYSFVQNCFIRSRKGNPLISIWRDSILNYWKHENSVINYFTHHLLFKTAVENNPIAERLFKKMPREEQDPTHELWFKHLNDQYTEELYHECTKDSFFQKTNFKCKEAENPIPGSVADFIINHN